MIREFTVEDYEQVSEWWKGHGWDAVPLQILPKLGIVVSDNGMDICAVWLYMDNSVGVCMLEWFVANPDATGRQVYKCEKLAQKFMEERALEMDYGVMMTTCKQESLARVHEKNGYLRTDESMIHLIKFLRTKEEE